MTGMIDANTKDNECGLLPYPIILAANKGDPEAMNYVILHYTPLPSWFERSKRRKL
ncbi:helix-turn-helix domain-containing protein [Oceanobacillus sp. MO10714A]|uniref:helix-turn-helix domain-containing protein n=1 Tax=Bacillaceae TaxID=186817 RepID=UPI0013DBCF1E|nr:helix-turn-helix domain-containing protein [Virgibacillus sp. YIM 98842]MBN6205183.1 helix-turn-helix domain-containing protein [Ralstonia pickettii]